MRPSSSGYYSTTDRRTDSRSVRCSVNTKRNFTMKKTHPHSTTPVTRVDRRTICARSPGRLGYRRDAQIRDAIEFESHHEQ